MKVIKTAVAIYPHAYRNFTCTGAVHSNATKTYVRSCETTRNVSH